MEEEGVVDGGWEGEGGFDSQEENSEARKRIGLINLSSRYIWGA